MTRMMTAATRARRALVTASARTLRAASETKESDHVE
jgi:hypothetical protein